MKKAKTLLGLLLALLLALSVFAAPAVAEDDMSKTVNLVYYLWAEKASPTRTCSPPSTKSSWPT
jgi:ABC-type proline/glycine betaine transport system substrate-binding protein